MINLTLTGNGNELQISLPQESWMLYRCVAEKFGTPFCLSKIELEGAHNGIETVTLTPTDEVGRHLLVIVSPKANLEEVNTLAHAVKNANQYIREKLHQGILEDKYHTIGEVYQGIKELTYLAAPIQETFYFPLVGLLREEDECEGFEVSHDTLVEHEDEIRAKLVEYADSDAFNMAGHYDRKGYEKLLSAIWDVVCIDDRLYGKVETRCLLPMTFEETKALKDWIEGQNSDGLGEGFEQQDIEIDMGTLNVSFWSFNSDYFIYTQKEMNLYLDMNGSGHIQI